MAITHERHKISIYVNRGNNQLEFTFGSLLILIQYLCLGFTFFASLHYSVFKCGKFEEVFCVHFFAKNCVLTFSPVALSLKAFIFCSSS